MPHVDHSYRSAPDGGGNDGNGESHGQVFVSTIESKNTGWRASSANQHSPAGAACLRERTNRAPHTRWRFYYFN
jgi:hypothetical protein